MKKYRDLSVKLKVPLVMGLASIFVFGLVCLLLLIPLRTKSLEDSSKIALNSAITAKEQLAEQINGTANVIRAFSGVIEHLFETNVVPVEKKREFLISELKMLTEHEMNNVWCIFEPDAFDGMDSVFANQPGSTSHGVFAPSISKGKLSTVANDLINSFLNEIPRRTGKEIISEVYSKKVNDENVNLFSVSIPIMVNGKYAGVIGTDFFTTELSNMIVKLTNANHRFRIATDKGIIALHRDPTRVGAQIDRGDPETLKKILEGKMFEGFGLFDGQEVYKIFVPIPLLNENIKPWFFALNIPREEIFQSVSQLISYLLIFCFFGIIMIVAVGWFLVVPLFKDVIDVTKIIDKLSLGNINLQIADDQSKDEIGTMKRKLQQLIQGLKNTAAFAQNIGNGHLSAEYNLLSTDDVLGNSLLDMRKSLLKAEEEQSLRAKEEEQRNWGTAGLAKFAEILRRDNNDMDALSYNVVSNLVKYLGINQGGIFVTNESEQEEERFLEMKACYAFDRRKFIDKKIRPGEGLVGTCYLEGEPIYITEVPNEYITITSGLGDANPRALLISPLKVNDEIYGVIELASFHSFEPYQLDFVKKVSESIAATISTVNVNIRTSLLLERTKIQTEEMANQEEELRQNMEEMQATQEESRRREIDLQDTVARMQETQAAAAQKEHEMKQFHNAIFETCNVIEFSPDAIITDVNQNFLNLFGIDRTAFVGKNLSTFVGEDAFIAVKASIRSGRIHEDVQRMNAGDGKTKTIIQKYVPINNKDGKLLRVLLLAFLDETEELRQNEEALRQTMEDNQHQLAKLDMTMEAADIGLWDMLIVEGDPINPNNAFTWSAGFRKLLGYASETEFPNVLSSWSDKLHPEDKDRTLNAFAAHIIDRTGKTPYDLEYRLLKKNGSYGYFRAFGETFRDPEGYAIRVAGGVQETTKEKERLIETKKSEKVFKEKAHWYESLLDAFYNTPISVTDMNKNITFLNQAALTILGKTREEAIGKHCGDVWGVDICKDDRCGIECLKCGKGKSVFNVGDAVFTTLASYIKDIEGNNVGHVEVVEDITETANRENEMKQFHSAIFDSCNIIMFSVDGVITDVNEKLLAIYNGKSKSEFIGRHMSEFVTQECYQAAWEHLMNGKFYEETQHIDTGAAGGIQNIHHRYIPICDKNGKMLWILLILHRWQ